MIDIVPVPAFRDNYIWLLADREAGVAAIVDPGDAAPVLAELEESRLEPVAILVTHHHPDHVGGIGAILQTTQAPVYGPVNEDIPHRTHALREGDTVFVEPLDIRFAILDMPGHTAGAIAYYGGGMVFVGDTLFMSGCGRLFEGTPAQMHRSLEKLAALPPETVVYCAHEYTLANLAFAAAVEPDNPRIQARLRECRALRERHRPTVPGTLAVEKQVNPFLRVREPHVAAAAGRHRGGSPISEPVEVFAALREWKDNF